jgi:hypothetical protein
MPSANSVAPTAGVALSELAFGPIGATLALLGLFQLLKQKLDEDSEAADKLGQLLALPDTAGVKGLQDAWDDATKSAADYYAKMQTAGQDEDPIATQIKRVKELADAQVESSKKIVEALGKEEIARIRVAGAQTGKSKAEIDAAVSASESNTESALAGLDQKKQATDGSSALIKEQQERLAASDSLGKAATNANRVAALWDDQAKNAETKRKSARDALDPTTEAGKALIKKRDDAAAAADAARELPTTRVDPLSGTVFNDPALVAERNKAITDAQAQQAAVQAEINNQKKASNTDLTDIETQKDIADKERDRTKAASVKNQTRLAQLPGEITQDQQVESAQSFGQNATDAVTAGQKALVGNANAELTNNVNDAITQLKQSQAASRALAQAARDAAAAHNDNAADLAKVFNDVLNSNLKLQARIRQLSAQIQAMASTGFK